MIIQFIPIYVVDKLRSGNVSSKFTFHDNNVFTDVSLSVRSRMSRQ